MEFSNAKFFTAPKSRANDSSAPKGAKIANCACRMSFLIPKVDPFPVYFNIENYIYIMTSISQQHPSTFTESVAATLARAYSSKSIYMYSALSIQTVNLK